MSLNNISLPSQLLADLYANSLVDGTATAMPQTPPVAFLGKGGKHILLVVNQAEVPYLPDNELAFLTKILTACQLGLADVAIVNWHTMPHHHTEALLEQFAATTVILFGTDPAPFGLSSPLPAYAIHSWQGRQWVVAPPLADIEKTKEAKGQLWLALKQLFGI